MTEMTSAERVRCVLRREQPDRVPHFEWLIARNVREALCPGCRGHNDFAVRMGHDAILVDPDFARTQVGPTTWRKEWGFVVDYGQEEHGMEVESPIRTMDDFEAWTPPDPHAPGRYDTIEKAVAEFKDTLAVGVHLNEVFSIPRSLMGMTNLLMAIGTAPDLVRALVKMSVDVHLEMAGEVAARGVDFIWTGDDYAYNSGPFMSPQHFRDLFYPDLKRFASGCRELGLPFIKHCDGNIEPILEMMIDSGITALDPIDPQGGMDLADIKARYGGCVAVKGNVDCGDVLSYGSSDDVIAETKRALRQGMPGGGFICSSSNSIHSAVRPENYRVMMETIREHGTYENIRD